MAVASIIPRTSYEGQFFLPLKLVRPKQIGMTCKSVSLQNFCKLRLPALLFDDGRKWHVLECNSRSFLNTNKQQRIDSLRMVHQPFRKFVEVPLHKLYCGTSDGEPTTSAAVYEGDNPSTDTVEAGDNGRQLKVLESYFDKLNNDMDTLRNSGMSTTDLGTTVNMGLYQVKSSSPSGTMMVEVDGKRDQLNSKQRLDSLEKYFGKLNSGKDTRSMLPDIDDDASAISSIKMPSTSLGESYIEDKMVVESKSHDPLENMNRGTSSMFFGDQNTEGTQSYDEASDFYIISILAAINIAVFLFEIASPIRNSDFEQVSLPLVYGAKINKLILIGEWWRLLTPMFLHSGLLHVSLGCWVLLTFGPQVCRGYGPFTFILIYVLGGICGNLTSFIHTPELTVCGTGPVFAIIGAWLVYQIQNKDFITKDVSESMFSKAMIATVLSFLLSNFGRIDDWTHLGATFSGIIFGFLTCPALQLDNASSKNGHKQGIALVQRQADPCKSLLIFTISILVLSSLVFLFEPQFEVLELDSIV